MKSNRRFGMSGKARYRLYSWLCFIVVVGLVIGGKYRWIAEVAFVGLLIWMGLFDRIGRDGDKTFLGFSSDQLRKLSIGSIFGRKIPD